MYIQQQGVQASASEQREFQQFPRQATHIAIALHIQNSQQQRKEEENPQIASTTH